MDRNGAPTTIRFGDFEKIEFRAGTIVRAEIFQEAKKLACKLWVDFGELGIRKSSTQSTTHYKPDTLLGKQVICVVNLDPRQIANFISEVLVTGFPDKNNAVVLCIPDQPVSNGARLF